MSIRVLAVLASVVVAVGGALLLALVHVLGIVLTAIFLGVSAAIWITDNMFPGWGPDV